MSVFDYLDKEEEMILAMRESKDLKTEAEIAEYRNDFLESYWTMIGDKQINSYIVIDRAKKDFKVEGHYRNFDDLICKSIANGNNTMLHELLARALHDLICEAMESDNV